MGGWYSGILSFTIYYTSFYLLNGTNHRQGDQQFNYRYNY